MQPERRFRLDRLELHLAVWDWSSFREDITLQYELWDRKCDPESPIFQGTDFRIPRGEAPLGNWSCLQLLGFLLLQEGDTDREYFDEYTTKQLQWRDEEPLEEWSWIRQKCEEALAEIRYQRQQTRTEEGR